MPCLRPWFCAIGGARPVRFLTVRKAQYRLSAIKSLAASKMGMGTREVGDLIAKMVS
jgi:hypothetical protein